MSSDKQSQTVSGKKWVVTYTQSDVDTIREQIQQGEAAKRRLLFVTLVVTAAALVGAIILLATSYSLYASSQSARDKIAQDFQALKQQSDKWNKELQEIHTREATAAREREEARSRLDGMLHSALSEGANSRDIAALAEMVFNLPDHEVTIEKKPPDNMFRNWKVNTGGGTSVYALVGGLVDGKWVIYSNLVSKRGADDSQ